MWHPYTEMGRYRADVDPIVAVLAQGSRIVDVHFPDLSRDLLGAALKAFYKLRGVDGLRKRPSTSPSCSCSKGTIATSITGSVR